MPMKMLLRGLGLAAVLVLLSACGGGAAPAAMQPEVGILTAQATDIPIIRDYPGRLAATTTAQVRSRTTGIVLRRVYREGTDVRAGQVLFQIDPAPLEAGLRAAEGQLAKAEATAANAELKAARSKELGAKGLLSKQDQDDAGAAAAEAAAVLQSARANARNARISLDYATVTAPITGRAGRANVTVGELVALADIKPLTTIQVVDPIFANFSQPLAELERLRAAERSGELKLAAADTAPVQLLLPDGSVYAHTGTLDFTDLAVDPQTGAVDLRAQVRNPDRSLLPGMFVTIRVTLGTLHGAFLLPQAAIQRDHEGAFVYSVGADDKLAEQRVELGDQRGGDWIVRAGLAAGTRVVVSGLQKARPGDAVRVIATGASSATRNAAAD